MQKPNPEAGVDNDLLVRAFKRRSQSWTLNAILPKVSRLEALERSKGRDQEDLIWRVLAHICYGKSNSFRCEQEGTWKLYSFNFVGTHTEFVSLLLNYTQSKVLSYKAREIAEWVRLIPCT